MSKDAFWFEHDSNAHSDPLIIKLRMKHGLAAYGAFWVFIESLRDSAGYKIEMSMVDAICFEYRIEKPWFEYMVDIGLLKSDGEFFWSDSLHRRMTAWDEKKEKIIKAARAGGIAKALKSSANGMPMAENGSTDGVPTEVLFPADALPIREEKRREEKSRDKKEIYTIPSSSSQLSLTPEQKKADCDDVTKRYITCANLVFGRSGMPTKTIYPFVEKRLKQRVDPWKIIAAPILIRNMDVHQGLFKRGNLYSVILRDGKNMVRGVNGGPSQPGIDWINSAIEGIDLIELSAEHVEIAKSVGIWDDLKTKIKAYNEN